MLIILTSLFIFLNLISLLIYIDIILSWFSLLWFYIKIKFIRDILDPIYNKIKSIIPTTIWIFDLTRLIVLILIILLQGFLLYLSPELRMFIHS